MFELRTIERLPVLFPEREIFLRLGGNIARTVLSSEEKNDFRRIALQAFECCRPCGRWGIAAAEVREDGIWLDDAVFVPGRDFAVRCAGVKTMWFGAVTVGMDVLVQRDGQTRVSAAAVYDAVAGECADAAMDQLQKLAAAELCRSALILASRRYSPGYGDMPLDVQKFFYERLKLNELNIRLTENNFLIPEKSVTAFAGVTEENIP